MVDKTKQRYACHHSTDLGKWAKVKQEIAGDAVGAFVLSKWKEDVT